MNRNIVLILISLVFLYKCDRQDFSNSKSSIFPTGGFMLSFDDNYIDNWYKISNLLDKYKCKATFFVSGFGYLDEESINLLKKLKNNGHEIAVHTLNHNSVADYLDNFDDYINLEVDSEIDSMLSNGFNPITFSYPFGINSNETDAKLLQKFKLIRDVTESQRHFYSMFFKDFNQLDEVFINDNSQKVLKAIGIDDNFNVSIDDIHKIFERASSNKEIVLFYCHDPVYEVSGDFQIRVDYLEKFLKLTNQYNLHSYRFMDLINH
ncbi:MAG: hypothetical protein CMG00_06640 [Candidatus Marinimicrobia bacterium]|nr:hypothetical protein [Candidatus Neomarinimicrobiota bacterium]|tara:strand:+ start:1469 stop:2260 length:792 start_codon:yes stop_codon:yes gene_type:complete